MAALQSAQHQVITNSSRVNHDLTSNPRLNGIELDTTHIKSSPYDNLANHLSLDGLDVYSRLFALALTTLEPIRQEYATAPWLEAFNWPLVFGRLQALCHISGLHWQKQEFYVVTFRSVRKRGADVELISELDQQSHREACESGGLLKYWFGSCDSEMRNLATCIWRDRLDATAGGSGPWHRKARMAAKDLYERIDFRTYKLVIDDNASSWRLEDYTQV